MTTTTGTRCHDQPTSVFLCARRRRSRWCGPLRQDRQPEQPVRARQPGPGELRRREGRHPGPDRDARDRAGPVQHQRQRRRARLRRHRDDGGHRARVGSEPEEYRRRPPSGPRCAGSASPRRSPSVVAFLASDDASYVSGPDPVHHRRRSVAGYTEKLGGLTRGLRTQRRGAGDPRHRPHLHPQGGDAARAGGAAPRTQGHQPGIERSELRSCSSRPRSSASGACRPRRVRRHGPAGRHAVADLDRDRPHRSCRSGSAARPTTSCSTPTTEQKAGVPDADDRG